MGGICASRQISPFRIEEYKDVFDDLNLAHEEAKEVLRSYDLLWGIGTDVVSKKVFVQTLIDRHICDYKRLDLDRLYCYASYNEAINERSWIKFVYNVCILQKKELPRLLFNVYSDDDGNSVPIDTVIAASQKMVGNYQVYISEWHETEKMKETASLHRQVCHEITGGKYYFNQNEFATYVDRHRIISMGLIILQRELRNIAGGAVMWDQISRRRVVDLLDNMTESQRMELEKDRKARKNREKKKQEDKKRRKQKDTLRRRLRHI